VPKRSHLPNDRSPTVAAFLEIVGGVFQLFGIGHIYAGHVLRGVIIMVVWWLIAGVNAALTLVLIGWVTGPICWLIYVILAAFGAASLARRPIRA
jgi:TM2 domain-containing membrane protein YozV